ncbi:MAG: trigger factor [Lachnospiraceae bacterium]|nr:trigger factor [Lachnospiraceae bacterium]
MNTQVERLEHSMVKLTVTVPAEDFKKALTKAYQKNRGRINIPGFRKGKAPQQIIERMYGPEIFYDDAVNFAINDTYSDAVKEAEIEFTSRPEFDVENVKKGEDLVYTALAAVRPEVVLGEYKGLEIPKFDAEVTDEDVEKALADEQKKNARQIEVTDRPVEDGDTVTLDYAGTIDGVAFDGGTAEDAPLKIGSGTFIPGFEEQLVGVSIGEDKDVVVTFPENYNAKELAGKEAVFACKIKKIQKEELPELDDEFAQDVSEFDTLDEYKEDLKKNLLKRKEDQAKTSRENAAVEKLVAATEIDVPDAMKNYEAENMFEEYAQQLQSQGIPVDMYLQYQGLDADKFKETLIPQADTRIRTRLVLEAVVEAEKIEISDEEFDAELARLAEQYKMEKEEIGKFIGDFEKEQMKKDLAVQKAITLLVENAKEA